MSGRPTSCCRIGCRGCLSISLTVWNTCFLSLNQSIKGTEGHHLLSRVSEVICEHGRRWQRDRWYWRAEGHPPSLNASEGFTTNNYSLASEQAPGLRVFVRMTWPPQPERPEYPECFFLVDFEQIPVFTES